MNNYAKYGKLSDFKLTAVCFTFCLLLTYRPILALPEYKLEVVNICKMHGTGLEVVVLSTF